MTSLGDAVEPDFFAERALAGEEFLLYVRAENGDAAAVILVEFGEESAASTFMRRMRDNKDRRR